MTAPAHKQTNPSAYPGQVKNDWFVVQPTDVEQQFKQWWMQYNALKGCPPADVAARAAWYAALGVKDCNNP